MSAPRPDFSLNHAPLPQQSEHNASYRTYTLAELGSAEWDDPCSIYIVAATYVPKYSDCSPGELGDDDFWLNDFEWSYGTKYYWPQTQLSIWTASGANDEVPGGPPGGECGFDGPQGNAWTRFDQNIPFQNWGGADNWEYLEFQYATDF